MTDYNEDMIDVIPICKQFKQYFDVDSRCILSAKFGDGKSYFLSQFTKMYSDEYLFITIYPVNYQVMENAEIFELIKRDILLRLLSENAIIKRKINYTKSFKIAYYLKQNYEKVLEDLIQIIPQFNFFGFEINLRNIHKCVKGISDGYKEWEKKVNETEEGKADKFIDTFNYRKGSINEFDIISQLIYNIISDYKRRNRKKVVLIIEDLDRIDPAHIFRILNVFSAHFDNKSYGEGNKYNFDKIITVCDYNNIKNIYQHVYGEKTDFVGYISKFSDRKPFHYSLVNLVKDYILNHLLDKKLLKYKVICNVLCDSIISTLNKENNSYNLRIVKERLLKSQKAIINVNIPLDKQLSGYSINSLNQFTYLIAITKWFDIEENMLLDKKYRSEIIDLVGVNWLLLSKLSKECFLDITQYGIKVTIMSYKGNNMSECYEAGKFDVLSLTEKIINEIKIDYNSGYVEVLDNFLFTKMNEIIEYYKSNIIL